VVTVAELEEVLALANVDPTYFSFDSSTHEALCMLRLGGTWQVFLSERGQRYEEQTFETEDGACVYFLKRVLELSRSA
jgi:hypothetical protein